MTTFRFGVVSAFVVALAIFLLSGPASAGDDLLRRAAVGPSAGSPKSVDAPRPDESRALPRRTVIGLSPVPYKPESSQQGEQAQPAARPGVYPDIRAVVRKVNRSVVSIRMLDSNSSWSLGGLGFSGDGNGKATGYGSGFIVSGNGHIVTNEHVLRNGTQIEVELLDGRKFQGKMLHKDSKNDLALIKIAATGLHPVTMGDSEHVELGEWVIGIGNPYGIGQSLMMGIVSAQKRLIPGSGYPPLIQIDAAMNLGNSGGPLFNLEGQVIGINTILLWKSQGIGFATPINVARDFIEKKTAPSVRAASASEHGPLGPSHDDPRSLPEPFTRLGTPWKAGR